MSKQGTPTMGGLMFIAAIAVVCLSVGFECMAEGEYGHLFCLAFALVFGAIGFLDDYEKLKKKQNLGLTAGKKLLLQLAAAVAFIFLMRRFGYVALDSLYIPFWNKTVPISEPLYVIFAAFVIVGTVNSVNLTDAGVHLFDLWGERFLSGVLFASSTTTRARLSRRCRGAGLRLHMPLLRRHLHLGHHSGRLFQAHARQAVFKIFAVIEMGGFCPSRCVSTGIAGGLLGF